ncbi:MAG TPA: PAS domain S-box protein, partial [Niastella sp.]|nr:PAS domain S-box protein [Niastella sp.]
MLHEASTLFQIPEPFYASLFEALPGNSVLVQNDAPRFTILAATPAYLKQTGYTKEDMIGKGVFEAFPVNNTDPNYTGGSDLLLSYMHVLKCKEPHYLPVQRYDLQHEDGSFTEKYWKVSNTPVFSPDGDVAYIIHTAEDITAEVKAKGLEEKMKGMEQAHALFLNAPVAINILKGPELIIELANAPCLEIWGKGTEIIGKSLLEVIPELQSQGYKELVQQIRETGQSHHAYEQRITLVRNNRMQSVYINWVLQPYYDKDQQAATGIITFATEVTQEVLARLQVEESYKEFRVVTDFMPQLIWLTRPDGYHYYYNKQWYDYTGLTYRE